MGQLTEMLRTETQASPGRRTTKIPAPRPVYLIPVLLFPSAASCSHFLPCLVRNSGSITSPSSYFATLSCTTHPGDWFNPVQSNSLSSPHLPLEAECWWRKSHHLVDWPHYKLTPPTSSWSLMLQGVFLCFPSQQFLPLQEHLLLIFTSLLKGSCSINTNTFANSDPCFTEKMEPSIKNPLIFLPSFLHMYLDSCHPCFPLSWPNGHRFPLHSGSSLHPPIRSLPSSALPSLSYIFNLSLSS